VTRSRFEPLAIVENGDLRIAVYRWGEENVDRPKLLLVHGTGFCAAVWQDVAESLARDFQVYAIDRRGHGRTSKPDDAYHFLDFSEDLVAVIDSLELDRAYGVGHSAGATDLLLSATRRPNAFRRLFAMEPTVMNPAAYRAAAKLSTERTEAIAQTARRRRSFPSFEDVLGRYRTRPAFLKWRLELLDLYVRYGFDTSEAGVDLLCRPEVECAMLVHIYAAMENVYAGDDRGNPFRALAKIESGLCCVSTAEKSGEIYKQMARIADDLIPNAASMEFSDAGHSVAQERPQEVVRALLGFWQVGL
jgi:pimeloyl-ACP methyl ester carboxylesterase